jgi:hypothetical protein
MKIYHLHINDNDDAKFDVDYHFSHETKNASDLWDDYNSAYVKVIDSDSKGWVIDDILDELENLGWKKMDIEKVEVEY